MNHSEILSRFRLEGSPVSCEPFGNGHINSTFLVTTDSGKRYILQRISPEAFKDVPALMNNIASVTDFLQKKAEAAGTKAHVLPQVRTVEGDTFIHVDTASENSRASGDAILDGAISGGTIAEAGDYRVTPFAEGSISLEAPETDEDFYECAVAFGTFISELADFPADTLVETIPNFHNTADRYRIFHEALEKAEDNPEMTDRLNEASEEIDFALKREAEAGKLQAMRDSGELPARVTHNDTKLNNVLLDGGTRKLMYVIDLDTVMPGLSLYDYGDCIRFGASTAAEDEKDLSKVHCDMHRFSVFTKGFLKACKGLTDREIELLPEGARTITLELGVRFLTDYLDGDRYFATKYPGHNLDRCRTQFRLVSDMENKWEEMNRIVAEAAKKV